MPGFAGDLSFSFYFLQLVHPPFGGLLVAPSKRSNSQDVGGGSSNSTSPQQAAAGALCSCVLHGRISLDDVALPLMLRMDQRLCALAMATAKREKELSSKTPVAARWWFHVFFAFQPHLDDA